MKLIRIHNRSLRDIQLTDTSERLDVYLPRVASSFINWRSITSTWEYVLFIWNSLRLPSADMKCAISVYTCIFIQGDEWKLDLFHSCPRYRASDDRRSNAYTFSAAFTISTCCGSVSNCETLGHPDKIIVRSTTLQNMCGIKHSCYLCHKIKKIKSLNHDRLYQQLIWFKLG